jgi:hypothetical protein
MHTSTHMSIWRKHTLADGTNMVGANMVQQLSVQEQDCQWCCCKRGKTDTLANHICKKHSNTSRRSCEYVCVRSIKGLAGLPRAWHSENVHALEGLACRARVTPASSPAAPASRVRRLRLCQAFSRMLWSQNSKSLPYI